MEPKEKAVQPKPAEEIEFSDLDMVHGAEPAKDGREIDESDAEILRSE